MLISGNEAIIITLSACVHSIGLRVSHEMEMLLYVAKDEGEEGGREYMVERESACPPPPLPPLHIHVWQSPV